MPVMLLTGGAPGAEADQVAGLTWWYDASRSDCYSDAGVTLSVDGGPVQQWNDRTANARHLPGIGAARPTFRTNAQNGRAIVEFDGTDDTMQRTANNDDNLIVVANMTGFAVFKVAGASATNWIWNINDGAQQVIASIQVAGPTIRSRNFDGSQDNADDTLVTGVYGCHTWLHTGGNVSSGWSDTRTASLVNTASGNTSTGVNANFFMRQINTPVVTSIAEVAIYNVALSEADRQLIERRLAWKWAITLPY